MSDDTLELTVNENPGVAQAEQASAPLEAGPEAPASEELQKQESPEMDERKVLANFGVSVALINRLTSSMSARQLGRVVRAIIVAPLFDETKNFVDKKEHELFQHIGISNQFKTMLVQNTLRELDRQYGSVTPPEMPSGENEGEKQNG